MSKIRTKKVVFFFSSSKINKYYFIISTISLLFFLGGPFSFEISSNDYSTHDLELAAIIHALKMWRHYLMGRKFLLKTDNVSLKYLFEQPDLNVRKARWLAFLSEYHFELNHIKGKENKIADVLS